ncbi:MAG: MBOAT family O-acyltransferase [Candidatus Krumholzibacteriia bacterium]
MMFNSMPFAVFLPVVFVAYWLLGARRFRAQNALLLAASYVFYGWWNWRFLSVVILVSIVNYTVGLRLHAATDPRRRRALLLVSLFTSLGALAVFKYADFFLTSFGSLLGALGLRADVPTLRLILPLGISFYTLQVLSYPLGIYYRRIEPTRRVVEFFAFVCFFPLLIAGPIERAGRLLPQFLQPRALDQAQIRDGLRQILNGFIKKVVIADNLAPHVQAIFADPSQRDGATLFIGAVFFAFQVYCDFSGYSDIAIGVARLFGFSVMQNFHFPYFSRDIGEFWRRWHISLSTWLRDYVFFPLGAGYGSRPRQIFNVLVTFLVSGLWHGANWTFVLWGAINGLYFLPLILGWRIVTYKRDVAAGRLLPRPREAVAMAVTFVGVVVAFVIFRADTLSQAVAYLRGLVTHRWTGGDLTPYLPMLSVCAGLWLLEWVQRKRAYALDIPRLPVALRWGIYVAGMLAFLIFGNFGAREFIYFQF